MQQIEIEHLGPEPLQAPLQRHRQGAAGGVVRIDLGDQKHLVPPAGDGFGYHLLCAAIGIHFGGVDQGQPEIEAEAQCGGLGLRGGAVLAHMPGALAQGGQRGSIRQCHVPHGGLHHFGDSLAPVRSAAIPPAQA